MKKDEKYKNVVKMYSTGLSIGDIAAHFGVNKTVMYRILQRRGCEFRKSGLKDREVYENEYRFRYFVLGMSVEEIATEYGISLQTARGRIGKIRKLDDQMFKVVSLLQSGLTMYAVGKKLRISASSVKYWMNKADVKYGEDGKLYWGERIEQWWDNRKPMVDKDKVDLTEVETYEAIPEPVERKVRIVRKKKVKIQKTLAQPLYEDVGIEPLKVGCIYRLTDELREKVMYDSDLREGEGLVHSHDFILAYESLGGPVTKCLLLKKTGSGFFGPDKETHSFKIYGGSDGVMIYACSNAMRGSLLKGNNICIRQIDRGLMI